MISEIEKKISNGVEISVVIPAYNEEMVIEDTINEVKYFLKNYFNNFEIIVVDDKSTDRTLEIIKNIDGINIVRNLKNHGKGYSVSKGIRRAKGDMLLFMDADNSTNIRELKSFLPEIEKYDLVIASRELDESDVQISQGYFKQFLGRMGNFISRLLIDKNIKDTQCGFKLIKKNSKYLFEQLTIEGFAFDFELIFLAKKNDLKIKEMPITWLNNFNSTVRWHDYPRTMINLITIRINNLLGKYN